MEVKLKFPGNCQGSINCDGCQLQIQKYPLSLIHNQDVIKVKTKLDTSNLNSYYEIRSYYEDSISEVDQYVIPFQHMITIERFESFSEVEDLPGIYACGGCNFVLYYCSRDYDQPKVICANGWKGCTDGWNNH